MGTRPEPVKHPSAFINKADADSIRRYAEAAEKAGSLHEEQLKIIFKNKWFNLFVPQSYGGLELALAEGLKLEEGLAYADGSTGWTVTLCSGANWFVGFLEKEAALEIFSDPLACLAGSGRPSGTARVIENGYEISGYWRYATGTPQATVFTANCLLEANGQPVTDNEGHPQMASFWFKKEEVQIDRNWQAMGMIATASESFAVENLRVPPNRRFQISNAGAVLPHPVYRYPFLQFAETTLAVNISGMAMRFLDLCGTLFAAKEKGPDNDKASSMAIREKRLESMERMQQLRTGLYTAVAHSWADLTGQGSIEETKLQLVSAASRSLACFARLLVEEFYPYCGLVAANPLAELNRVWRNLHTASQHSLLNFPGVIG
jgi:indole-3-acetate monooxygenase